MATKVITMCDVCETTEGEVMPVKVNINGTNYIADLCEADQEGTVLKPLAKFMEVANATTSSSGGMVRNSSPLTGPGSAQDIRAYFAHIEKPISPKGRISAEDRATYDKAMDAGDWPVKA